MKEPLLISACLLGAACRYDGASRPLPQETLAALREHYALIPVCPEQLGGLPTPRPSAERRAGGVFTAAGTEVTAQYARGAAEALRLAEFFGCRMALLKARSPSCGSGAVYDGSFTGTLRSGDGVTAAALKAAGIAVYTEAECSGLLQDA
jgi:uncharacterized protein YbbK (DUF523 family)